MAATYSSENIALAVHETVVHLRTGGLPLNRYLLRIDVPDDVWAARHVLTPPVGWDALPAGMVSVDAVSKDLSCLNHDRPGPPGTSLPPVAQETPGGRCR